LVIIIVVMVVATGFLSSQMFSYANNFKIGYIFAVADKAVFVEGEGVSFELRSLTPDVPFTAIGNTDGSGIYIYRIPSGMTPEEYLQKLSTAGWLDNPSAWGRITFGSFHETDSPLKLTWNGTYEVSSYTYGMAAEYFRATSGYYLLFPRFNMYEVIAPKPMIDSSSIFYYDSMIAESNLTGDPEGGSMTANISLRLSEGSEPLSSCPLVCSQQVWGGGAQQEHHNFTVDLGPDHWTNETFLASAFFGAYWGIQVRAILTTPDGDYLFGFDAQRNGGDLIVKQF
jgi:hypothetical protein